MRRQPLTRDDVEPRPQAATPRDAGTLAARAAIRAVLGHDLAAARSAGLVVLRLPDDSWVPAAVEAWAGLLHGGREPRRTERLATVEAGDWVALPQDARGTLPVEEIERALVAGVPCLVVAVQPSWVSPVVAALADLDVTVRLLDWRTLRYAALRSAGPPPVVRAGRAVRGCPVRGFALPAAPGLPPSRRGRGPAAPRIRRRGGRLSSRAARARAGRFPGPGARAGDGRCPGMGYQLAADLRAFCGGTLPWRDVDRAAVLVGPPGVGKTSFARALAEEAGVPLIATSHARWQAAKDGHLGTMLAAMQRSFAETRAAAPCIMPVDELDSFPARDGVRHDHADYVRSMVNGLLQELDGALGREGVAVLGACNDACVIDPAVVRPGRLERVIVVGPPDAACVAEIMRVHLGDNLAGADLTEVAREAAALGLTGAEVELFVREARRVARVQGVPLGLDHLQAVIAGPEDDRDPEFLWRVAMHEAGPAIGHEAMRPGTLMEVSIRLRGISGGRTQAEGVRDEELTPSAIRGRLVSLLAARAAEELLLGEPGAGSDLGGGNDLAQATRMAALAVAALGYDEEAGLVWQGIPPAGEGLARWLAMRPAVAMRVRAMLEGAQDEARRIVGERREAVIAVAEVLLERRMLAGNEVRTVLGRTVQPPLAA